MFNRFKINLLHIVVLVCVFLVLPTTTGWAPTDVHSATESSPYQPTWESLDRRSTPQWYRDAKFGIFIHWGLYSVPAWSPRGTYAEWYWQFLEGKNQDDEQKLATQRAVQAFHKRVYGEDHQYADFRKQFTCELFEPDHWAKVFERSGAKYVVLTSKHHDGYCLFPNQEACDSFGMAWDSTSSGPRRDLVGDLTTSVRATGLKMGLYYSIWDWFNPYWPESDQIAQNHGTGLQRYVREVMTPQFKQIVRDYQPALIFSDGDWWMDDEKWETKPLLAWLFNHAPNKEEVVINDRWGQVRGQHGGYYTTEYGSGFDEPNILWEENRGIGKSFGFNREETLADYNSAKLLIYMLVDIVSRGGNFLLDVGPTADGRIPVIMEDRLTQMGQWLEVNGAAIFGTRRWIKDAQWSEGIRPTFSRDDHHYGEPVFKMTCDPDPGHAVKECWFTHKGDTLFVLIPGWPQIEALTVKDVNTTSTTRITLLGCEKQIAWKQVGEDLKIDLHNIGIHDLPCEHIYTFAITDCR